MAVVATLASFLWLAPSGFAQCQTYTTSADFDLGLLINVNHNPPYEDQLHLNSIATPFPFVNIACSDRGTVTRIDVNTGTILGEYLTSPDGMGRNPSRTTVDQQGNAWVANRNENGISGGIPKGSITRIALVIGGTRCDADGTPNPVGQYLKPPFQYSTAQDRDGDGLIKTSSGLGNILSWTNAGGVDTHGGVATADDECIINYTRVTGTGTRTVAIDANNDVWVGGIYGAGPYYNHEKVDGLTGQPVPGTQFNIGCGGYGGLIDGNGILWSASQCSGAGLLRYDPSSTSGVCLGGRGDYGLGIDPNTGHIWQSSLCGSPYTLYELDAAGNVLNSYPQPFGAQGVCVDGNSHVWMAEIFGSHVWHLAPDLANPGTHLPVGIVGGFVGTTGVAVDANGKIWAAEIGDRASRVDPNAGPIGGGGYPVGVIDLSVPLGAGAGPYNYSDMTGFVSIGTTAPQGTWTNTYDGGSPGTNWGKVCWNYEACSQPAGSSITVRVRSSEDQVTWTGYVDATNCVDFDIADGRYLQVEVKLVPNTDGESPILCDVTICTGIEPVAIDIKPQSCPNPFNVRNEGLDDAVLPVAILGTADFDVATVDPASVELEGVSPMRWAYEDVAAPLGVIPPEECECTTAGPDGFLDLTLKFNRAEIVGAIGPVNDGDVLVLTLTGMTLEGGRIQGSDCVIIRQKGKSAKLTSLTPGGISLVNYPNPFNAATSIHYSLTEGSHVRLAVYNMLGQTVRTLVDQFQASGEFTVTWDGRGDAGQPVASGLYLSQLEVGSAVVTRKMSLLK
jgi:streptogramin lyase